MVLENFLEFSSVNYIWCVTFLKALNFHIHSIGCCDHGGALLLEIGQISRWGFGNFRWNGLGEFGLLANREQYCGYRM